MLVIWRIASKMKYPELAKILPQFLDYYQPLIPAQHMGTVGEDVPVPSLIVEEIKEILKNNASSESSD